jgi:hypothetical protein
MPGWRRLPEGTEAARYQQVSTAGRRRRSAGLWAGLRCRTSPAERSRQTHRVVSIRYGFDHSSKHVSVHADCHSAEVVACRYPRTLAALISAQFKSAGAACSPATACPLTGAVAAGGAEADNETGKGNRKLVGPGGGVGDGKLAAQQSGHQAGSAARVNRMHVVRCLPACLLDARNRHPAQSGITGIICCACCSAPHLPRVSGKALETRAFTTPEPANEKEAALMQT